MAAQKGENTYLFKIAKDGNVHFVGIGTLKLFFYT